MTTISHVRGCKPESMTAFARDLSAQSNAFNARVDQMDRDVDAAMDSWKGEAASATSVRAISEKLGANHIGSTVITLADTFNTYGAQLGASRNALLSIVDGDIPAAGMTVDDEGNVKAPQVPGARSGDLLAYLLQAQLDSQAADFQVRVKELLAQFGDGENQAAQAISTGLQELAGYRQRPDGAPVGPQIQAILDGRSQPPADPEQFHDFWDALSPAEKDALYQRDRYIGNRDGMPAVDRDYYNRETLADELVRARSAIAQADALRAQHPDWAAGNNVPSPNEPGAIFDDRLAYEAWKRRYDAALGGTRTLPDLQAVDKAVGGKPDRKLLLLDTQNGRQAHAAVAIGDPDTATHVSVTAPGLNTTVHGAITGMAEEATNMRLEALRQLATTPGRTHETVSAIAWIGYDAPQIPGLDESGRSLAGAWGVSHDDLARTGARGLAGFYDGIGAAHDGGPAHLTAIGHSYGSLTTGLALQEPGNHGVSDALFYGSPGIEASTPQQLHLQPGHVYAMETPDDPIQLTYDAPPLARAGAPFLPFPFNVGALGGLSLLDASGAGQFGPNPATNTEFTRLGTGPAIIPDGHGGTLSLEGAHGHSDYPRQGGNNLPRTTGYNIAAVVADLSHRAIPGS
ncbi:alpha/beta hydrolase [Mycobacterium sp. 23]|uniref:alpha/beta hydrolase n=1 Tax=Mycobacterium sp. 23 TaxID=3400424 RepID=UPI003AAAFF29